MFQIDDFDFDVDLDEESIKGITTTDLTPSEPIIKNHFRTNITRCEDSQSTTFSNDSLFRKSPTETKSPQVFKNPIKPSTSNLTPKRPTNIKWTENYSKFLPSSSHQTDKENIPDSPTHDFISDLFNLDENDSGFKKNQPTHRETSKVVRQRKFPGPAGLLPQRNCNTSFIATEDFLSEIENETKNQEFENNEVLSQQSGALFDNSDSWLALLQDLGPSGKKLIQNLNLSIFPKVLKRNLRGCKVPFLAVMVVSVDCSLQDPFLELKDTAGEMPAILHRDVWENMSSEISPGSVIVLKNVGVISAGISNRKFILNITENNITAIYYSGPEYKKVQSKILSELPNLSDAQSILQEWNNVVESLPVTPIRTPGDKSKPFLFNQTGSGPPEKKTKNISETKQIFQVENTLIKSLFDGLDANDFFCDF